MALLTNVWHLRTVAETSSKPCYICFKPTSAVLITPDNKDHFYICRGHLKDRGFASPIVNQAEEDAKKKKEALDREIALIKKEYEEKAAKKAKSKDKKDAGKDSDDKKKEETDDDAKKGEKEMNDKIQAISNKQPSSSTDDIPRIYELHKNIFQMRLDRIRNAEITKRNRERLKNPSAFPSVPRGDL